MTTQLDSFVGLKKETAYGTYAAPGSFLTFTDESIDRKITYKMATGMRPGRRTTTVQQMVPTQFAVGGDVTVEAASAEQGILWEAALGLATHTLLSGGTYQHLFTPAADYLPSYTIQKAIPPLGGGALMPYTFGGMQCSQLVLDGKAGDIPTLKATWVGQNLIAAQSVAYNPANGQTTNPGAATPVYPAVNELFTFVGGSILTGVPGVSAVTPPTATALATGGVQVGQITDATITIDNGLDSGGFNLGGGGARTRPAAALEGKNAGSFTAEFWDASFWGYYTAGTPLSAVLNYVGSATGDAAYTNQLQVVVPALKLTGETPQIKSGSIVTQKVPFSILQDIVNGYNSVYVALRNKVATL